MARPLALRLLLGVVLLLMLASPNVGFAQPDGGANREAARQLGREALDAYNAGDYPAALDKFRRAHQLVGLTSTGVFIARSLEKLGRLVEASEMYLEVTRMPLAADAREQHVAAKSEAAKEREVLLARIPQLTIVIVGAPDPSAVVVTIDGVAVPAALLGAKRPTDPGAHVVEAKLGSATAKSSVKLAEGEQREVVLDLGAAVPPSAPGPVGTTGTPEPNRTGPARFDGSGPKGPAPFDGSGPKGPVDASANAADSDGSVQRTIGWVAFGIGGAALIMGAATGGAAVKLRSDLRRDCLEVIDGFQCGPDQHGKVDTYNALRIVSSVGLIGGGVLAVGGLILALTAPEAAASARILPVALPGGAGVMGRF